MIADRKALYAIVDERVQHPVVWLSNPSVDVWVWGHTADAEKLLPSSGPSGMRSLNVDIVAGTGEKVPPRAVAALLELSTPK